MTAPIRLNIADGIAHLWFNRPKQMDVIDVEVAEAFQAAAKQATSEKSC